MKTRSVFPKTMLFIIGLLAAFAFVSCGNGGENAEPSFFLTMWHLPWFWAVLAAYALNCIAIATSAKSQEQQSSLKMITRLLCIPLAIAVGVFCIILFFKLEHWYYALYVCVFGSMWEPVAEADGSKCPAAVSFLIWLLGVAATVAAYVLFF